MHVLLFQQDIEEIKEGLEKACKVMYNQKLVKECQAFVDTYTHAIIDIIAKGATPKEVRSNLLLPRFQKSRNALSGLSCRCRLDVIRRKLPSDRVTVDCGKAFLLF